MLFRFEETAIRVQGTAHYRHEASIHNVKNDDAVRIHRVRIATRSPAEKLAESWAAERRLTGRVLSLEEASDLATKEWQDVAGGQPS